MVAPTAKPLSDTEVLTRIEAKVRECVGWYDSKLSKSRERVMKYYNGEWPKRQNEGSSSYVSTDVYDMVEMMKAQLLETFSGNDHLVKFSPQGPEDVQLSMVSTEYCSYVVFRENDGFGVFNSAMHDGLTSRIGITKVYWDEKYEYDTETFDAITYEDVDALTSDEGVDNLEANLDPTTGAYSGTLTRKRDVSKVTIEAVAPEEFFVSPRARSLKDRNYLKGQRTIKTRQDLIDMGFPKSKVMLIPQDNEKMLDWGPEKLARYSPVESIQTTDDPVQPELERVTLYECYTNLTVEPSKGMRYYKISYAGNTLLDKQEIDDDPYVSFVPLPVPHSVYGNNYAERVIPTQNSRTVLIRSILDHTITTNNPRYVVVKGALLNPKELLDNRFGGIVNSSRPDGVLPLPQAQLNPHVFNTLGMLQASREETTGISALSQGLNGDVINKQNSEGLVDKMVTASQQRQKIIARQFAEYLKELYIKVYSLVLANAKNQQPKIIEIAGSFQPISVAEWKERKDVSISFHLGFNERDKEAKQIATMYHLLAQDPALQPCVTIQNRYNMAVDAIRAQGHQNVNAYITSPDKVDPPKPDPFKEGELEVKKMTAQAALMNAQANAEKARANEEYEKLKIIVEQQAQKIDALAKQRELDRKDFEASTRADVAYQELELARQTPDKERNAIISPN